MKDAFQIAVAKCERDVTLLLTRWSYISFVLSHNISHYFVHSLWSGTPLGGIKYGPDDLHDLASGSRQAIILSHTVDIDKKQLKLVSKQKPDISYK